ncbi:hypothetical protein SBADM41S_11201 [Streptomyces badius]
MAPEPSHGHAPSSEEAFLDRFDHSSSPKRHIRAIAVMATLFSAPGLASIPDPATPGRKPRGTMPPLQRTAGQLIESQQRPTGPLPHRRHLGARRGRHRLDRAGATPAEPAPTAAQVKAKVDRLYHARRGSPPTAPRPRRTPATVHRRRPCTTRPPAAPAVFNTARHALGSLATAQYRLFCTLDPALTGLPRPRRLSGTRLLPRPGGRPGRPAAAAQHHRQVSRIAQGEGPRRRGDRTPRRPPRRTARAPHRGPRQARRRPEAARTTLTAADNAPTIERLRPTPGTAAARTVLDRSTARPRPASPLLISRRRAGHSPFRPTALIGKPYVWGATWPERLRLLRPHPGGLEGGGREPAAHHLHPGQRRYSASPRFRLAPGDLVFFYSGISHVGLAPAAASLHARAPGERRRVSADRRRAFAGAPAGRRAGQRARPQTSRRAVAQRVSSCRLESWSFRSTAETCDSHRLHRDDQMLAISLYGVARAISRQGSALALGRGGSRRAVGPVTMEA